MQHATTPMQFRPTRIPVVHIQIQSSNAKLFYLDYNFNRLTSIVGKADIDIIFCLNRGIWIFVQICFVPGRHKALFFVKYPNIFFFNTIREMKLILCINDTDIIR